MATDPERHAPITPGSTLSGWMSIPRAVTLDDQVPASGIEIILDDDDELDFMKEQHLPGGAFHARWIFVPVTITVTTPHLQPVDG